VTVQAVASLHQPCGIIPCCQAGCRLRQYSDVEMVMLNETTTIPPCLGSILHACYKALHHTLSDPVKRLHKISDYRFFELVLILFLSFFLTLDNGCCCTLLGSWVAMGERKIGMASAESRASVKILLSRKKCKKCLTMTVTGSYRCVTND
jgi:hypothetical protein